MSARRRYVAEADRNRRATWRVVDRQTGKIILKDHPAAYAREVARDCNADPSCVWLRSAAQ